MRKDYISTLKKQRYICNLCVSRGVVTPCAAQLPAAVFREEDLLPAVPEALQRYFPPSADPPIGNPRLLGEAARFLTGLPGAASPRLGRPAQPGRPRPAAYSPGSRRGPGRRTLPQPEAEGPSVGGGQRWRVSAAGGALAPPSRSRDPSPCARTFPPLRGLGGSAAGRSWAPVGLRRCERCSGEASEPPGSGFAAVSQRPRQPVTVGESARPPSAGAALSLACKMAPACVPARCF